MPDRVRGTGRDNPADTTRSARTHYEPGNFGVLRAPLLPVEVLTAAAGEFARRAEVDGDAGGLLSDPRVRAALAVGSPATLDAMSRTPTVDTDSKLGRTLQRYLTRMSSRPTPYGLFAGCELIRWDRCTDTAMGSARPRTRTRPDMRWLLSLVRDLESDPKVRRELSFVANQTITERAGRLSVTDPLELPGATEATESAVSVRATRATRLACELARTPITYDDLAARIAETTAAPRHRAERLIDQLWEHGILLTTLRPSITGDNPAQHLIDSVAGIAAAADVVAQLQRLQTAMTQWDSSTWEHADLGYRDLVELGSQSGRPWSHEPPQVDMAVGLVSDQIHAEVAHQAARAAELLVQLSPQSVRAGPLDAYRERFVERYGHDRRVPLLELLDPNAGLGSPYAADRDPGIRAAGDRDRILVGLAGTALNDGTTALELDEASIAALSSQGAVEPPPSLDISIAVLAATQTAIDTGDFQVVIGPGVGAQSAGQMLGRFANLLGRNAADALTEVAKRESEIRPGVIFAELVYLPKGDPRRANVVVRQHVRTHEIVVGTTPIDDHVARIGLNELEVEYVGSRLRLWSTTEGREIAVTVTHMGNPFFAPDVCRFLTDLRYEREAPLLGFDWGAASHLPALPRVQVGKVILCPARYRADDLMRIAGDATSDFATFVGEWRVTWKVPRFVHVGTHDNLLLVDLDNPLHVKGLQVELRRFDARQAPTMQEALPAPEHAWLPGSSGHHLCELVVPVFRTTHDPEPVPPRVAQLAPTATRARAPGSDWLYAKLYSPLALQDDVLIDARQHSWRRADDGLLFDSWFFIRYADPDPHVRMRFRGDPDVLLTRLIPQICSWADDLMQRGLCHRFAFDTYEREVERYGGPAGIDIAEKVFAADSEAVSQIIALRRTGAIDFDDVVLAALTGADLLAALGCDGQERLRWCRSAEARSSGRQAVKRADVRDLRRLMTDGLAGAGGSALSTILSVRRQALSDVKSKLADTVGLLGEVARSDVLASYVHMHCNRLVGIDRDAERMALATMYKVLYGLSVS